MQVPRRPRAFEGQRAEFLAGVAVRHPGAEHLAHLLPQGRGYRLAGGHHVAEPGRRLAGALGMLHQRLQHVGADQVVAGRVGVEVGNHRLHGGVDHRHLAAVAGAPETAGGRRPLRLPGIGAEPAVHHGEPQREIAPAEQVVEGEAGHVVQRVQAGDMEGQRLAGRAGGDVFAGVAMLGRQRQRAFAAGLLAQFGAAQHRQVAQHLPPRRNPRCPERGMRAGMPHDAGQAFSLVLRQLARRPEFQRLDLPERRQQQPPVMPCGGGLVGRQFRKVP